MAARTIDVHAHVLFPKVMGKCGAAGPEMGLRDGVQFSDERIDALLKDDVELNAQGLVVWLERQKRAA